MSQNRARILARSPRPGMFTEPQVEVRKVGSPQPCQPSSSTFESRTFQFPIGESAGYWLGAGWLLTVKFLGPSQCSGDPS